MRHKGGMILGICAAVFMGAGGIALGAGLALGGSPAFYYDGDQIFVKENFESVEYRDNVLEKKELGTLKTLDIEVNDARVRIVEGDTFALEYSLNGIYLEPEWNVEKQTLTFQENTEEKERIVHPYWLYEWWGYEYPRDQQESYVEITIPADAKMEEVTLVTGSGDIEMTAEVYMKELDIRSKYGELYAYINEGTSMDVQLGSGNAVIMPNGSLEAFDLSLHTQYGVIAMPTGIVKEENRYGEEQPAVDYVTDGRSENCIRVYTDGGDIRIR